MRPTSAQVFWYSAEIARHFVDVAFAEITEHRVLAHDIADLHAGVALLGLGGEGNGDVIHAAQLLTDDAGAERIAQQADHKVQHGRAVAAANEARVLLRGEQFLRKIGKSGDVTN